MSYSTKQYYQRLFHEQHRRCIASRQWQQRQFEEGLVAMNLAVMSRMTGTGLMNYYYYPAPPPRQQQARIGAKTPLRTYYTGSPYTVHSGSGCTTKSLGSPVTSVASVSSVSSASSRATEAASEAEEADAIINSHDLVRGEWCDWLTDVWAALERAHVHGLTLKWVVDAARATTAMHEWGNHRGVFWYNTITRYLMVPIMFGNMSDLLRRGDALRRTMGDLF